MRGRLPQPLTLAPGDQPVLHEIARGETLPWWQVRRVRIVLARASGVRPHEVAAQLACDPTTIWRTCREYEAAGLLGLFATPPRSGRPEHISPLGPGSARGARLSGTGRRRLVDHALVQRGPRA